TKSRAYDFVIQERIRPLSAINQRVTKSKTYKFVIQERNAGAIAERVGTTAWTDIFSCNICIHYIHVA
ncbi:MAG: hypothetical protein QM500_21470, partial [Methylococcales bacterium]